MVQRWTNLRARCVQSCPTDEGEGDDDGNGDGEGDEDEDGGMDLDAELDDIDSDVGDTIVETEDF